MSYPKQFSIILSVFLQVFSARAQHLVNVKPVLSEHKVIVTVDGAPFTSFIFTDSLEKPVLWPIYASGEHTITRGFPLDPKPGEPTDHPHHVGLWFNYENVNGFDFWNNSGAIPPGKKSQYGWIKTDSIVTVRSGMKGQISYTAHWQNQAKEIFLKEATGFFFSVDQNLRVIDRISTLTAVKDVTFPDVKDGMLGLRVTPELQLPDSSSKQFTDNKGITSTVDPSKTNIATGNYLTSENKTGDAAWGTRALWCMLYGKIGTDTISIVIIDYPKNPGFPTYWHARGYGLFAANPLGEKVFSNGKEILNFNLKKGTSATFRYRILIATGKTKLSTEEINRLALDFAGQY